MNRWLGVGLVAALLIVGWFAYARPDMFPGDVDVTRVIWLLMALLLVAGGLFGYGGARVSGNQVLAAVLLWGGLLAAIVWAYTLFN